MAGKHPSGRVYFTVNDLRHALNRLVMADPATGDRPVVMESQEGFLNWNGTFWQGGGDGVKGYTVLEEVKDEFEFDPAAEEWVRLPVSEGPKGPRGVRSS